MRKNNSAWRCALAFIHNRACSSPMSRRALSMRRTAGGPLGVERLFALHREAWDGALVSCSRPGSGGGALQRVINHSRGWLYFVACLRYVAILANPSPLLELLAYLQKSFSFSYVG